MAFNLTRIFKGKSQAEGLIADVLVDTNETAGPVSPQAIDAVPGTGTPRVDGSGATGEGTELLQRRHQGVVEDHAGGQAVGEGASDAVAFGAGLAGQLGAHGTGATAQAIGEGASATAADVEEPPADGAILSDLLVSTGVGAEDGSGTDNANRGMNLDDSASHELTADDKSGIAQFLQDAFAAGHMAPRDHAVGDGEAVAAGGSSTQLLNYASIEFASFDARDAAAAGRHAGPREEPAVPSTGAHHGDLAAGELHPRGGGGVIDGDFDDVGERSRHMGFKNVEGLDAETEVTNGRELALDDFLSTAGQTGDAGARHGGAGFITELGEMESFKGTLDEAGARLAPVRMIQDGHEDHVGGLFRIDDVAVNVAGAAAIGEGASATAADVETYRMTQSEIFNAFRDGAAVDGIADVEPAIPALRDAIQQTPSAGGAGQSAYAPWGWDFQGLVERLRGAGLIDTSTGEIVWVDPPQSQAADQELDALISWLRSNNLIDTSTGEVVWIGAPEPHGNNIAEAGVLLDWIQGYREGGVNDTTHRESGGIDSPREEPLAFFQERVSTEAVLASDELEDGVLTDAAACHAGPRDGPAVPGTGANGGDVAAGREPLAGRVIMEDLLVSSVVAAPDTASAQDGSGTDNANRITNPNGPGAPEIRGSDEELGALAGRLQTDGPSESFNHPGSYDHAGPGAPREEQGFTMQDGEPDAAAQVGHTEGQGVVEYGGSQTYAALDARPGQPDGGGLPAGEGAFAEGGIVGGILAHGVSQAAGGEPLAFDANDKNPSNFADAARHAGPGAGAEAHGRGLESGAEPVAIAEAGVLLDWIQGYREGGVNDTTHRESGGIDSPREEPPAFFQERVSTEAVLASDEFEDGVVTDATARQVNAVDSGDHSTAPEPVLKAMAMDRMSKAVGSGGVDSNSSSAGPLPQENLSLNIAGGRPGGAQPLSEGTVLASKPEVAVETLERSRGGAGGPHGAPDTPKITLSEEYASDLAVHDGGVALRGPDTAGAAVERLHEGLAGHAAHGQFHIEVDGASAGIYANNIGGGLLGAHDDGPSTLLGHHPTGDEITSPGANPFSLNFEDVAVRHHGVAAGDVNGDGVADLEADFDV